MNLRNLLSGLSGILFGVGLTLAGMTQPSKVIRFLDVTGDWDPSLAFVMAAAIAVYAPLYRLATRRTDALFGTRWSLPTRKDIDARLLIGAAIFGIGWGLGGFCPGPGITSAASGNSAPVVFTIAMLGGMGIYEMTHGELAQRRARSRTAAKEPLPTAPQGEKV